MMMREKAAQLELRQEVIGHYHKSQSTAERDKADESSKTKNPKEVSFASPTSECRMSTMKYLHVERKQAEKSFRNAQKNKSAKSQNVNFLPFNLVAFTFRWKICRFMGWF